MGNWQREGERRRRRRRRGVGGGGGGGGGGAKENENVVEKIERHWMETMESLESVGLYLILVARRPMSNRGERDGGQERGTTPGDGPTCGPGHPKSRQGLA